MVFKKLVRENFHSSTGVSVATSKVRIGTSELQLLGSNRVDIYFDEEQRLLGIKPNNNGEFVLRGERRNEIWFKPFIERFNLEKGRYKATWVPEKGMLIVDLNRRLSGSDV